MHQRMVKIIQPGCWGLIGGLSVLLIGCSGSGQVALETIESVPAPFKELTSLAAEPSVSQSPEPKVPQGALAQTKPERLVLAARYGQEDVVDALLKGGMPVDSQDAYGNTALIAAASNGQTSMVNLLLTNGANIDMVSNEEHTALMAAASRGDYQLVHRLIQAGASVDVKNNKGETALFLAAQHGHHSTMRVLLNAAAKPNIQNTVAVNSPYAGYTPLMYAVTQGVTDKEADWPGIVKLLLNNAADPNVANRHGDTALTLAQGPHKDVIVNLLVQAGAKDNRAYAGLDMDLAIIKAARLGNAYKLEQLLANGANANYVDNHGITPLLAAAYEGHLHCVRQLVTAGAEVNFVSRGLRQFAMANSRAPLGDRELMVVASRGDTPLITAIRKGHTQVVAYLLEQGAEIDLANSNGEVPIFVAAAHGDKEAVQLLLKKGVDPNTLERENRSNQLALARGTMGRDSVLIRSAQQGYTEVLRLLLEAGATINYRGYLGKTALYSAAERGQYKVSDLLLAKGADTEIASLAGITPLMEAAKLGNLHIVQALLQHNADVNVVERPELGYASMAYGSNSMTALMFAAKHGHLDVVEALVLAGAQVNLHDANGKNATEQAKDGGYDRIAQFLENNSVSETGVTLFTIEE